MKYLHSGSHGSLAKTSLSVRGDGYAATRATDGHRAREQLCAGGPEPRLSWWHSAFASRLVPAVGNVGHMRAEVLPQVTGASSRSGATENSLHRQGSPLLPKPEPRCRGSAETPVPRS